MLDYEPIATTAQFQAALLQMRDERLKPTDIPIFKAFCDAQACTLTATKLAEICHFRTWNESNLRFGLLAQRVGKALGYTPSKRTNGTLRWWQSAAFGAGEDEADTGQFQWTLRPELVEALRRMKWV